MNTFIEAKGSYIEVKNRQKRIIAVHNTLKNIKDNSRKYLPSDHRLLLLILTKIIEYERYKCPS